MSNTWDSSVTESDVEALKRAFGGNLIGFGNKVALLIIDMSYGFVDSSFPLGSSETGWPCVANIQSLLDIAREKQIPVIYTTGAWRNNKIERGLWKSSPEVEKRMQEDKAYQIVDEIAPLHTEPVIYKSSPSGFHGTNMVNMLVRNNVDTVIITGMVTSGCVYATVIDAFSYGFRVIIPEEAVADRSSTVHEVSLFSIHMKYGDVIKINEVKKALFAYRVKP